VDDDNTCQTLFIPSRHPHQGLGVSFRCAKEAFSIGILADAFEYGADGGGESDLTGGFLSRGSVDTRKGGLCFWVNG
jgi:hypothetical protein